MSDNVVGKGDKERVQNLPDINYDKVYARRWWIVAAVLIGTWVGTLGNSMMPVALPSIIEDYEVGLNLGVWVISVYVLLVAVFMPIFGWLGDRYGYRRIYLIGLVAVAVFSWAAALSPTFGWLIAFRALQGIGNATTLPAVMGIISQVFPSQERGLALGVWSTVNGAAHGLGPVISGLLVQNYNWPATFWFNGAITFLGAGFVFLVVPADRKLDERPFDLLGAGAFTMGILTLMFNLSQGSGMGWGSWLSLGLWVVFASLMALFLITEKRVSYPFIDLKLFNNRRYTAVTTIAGAQYFCLMGLPTLIALYLIQLRGVAIGTAGLLIAPLAVTLALFSPLGGRTVDRLGYQKTMIGGMTFVTLASGNMVFWGIDTPNWIIVLTLIVIGFGLGFTQSPSATGVTLVVRDDERGIALGIFHMLRFISGTLSVTIFGLILENARLNDFSLLQAFHWSFYLIITVAASSVMLAISMPGPPVKVATRAK